jgi:predicted CoA-binding protein
MSAERLTDEDLKTILTNAKTIAVVGLSENPSRDSNGVASYLKKNGYRIIPVNPSVDEILGEKSYPDLLSIKDTVDVVDVFRQPQFLPEIAEQAVKIKAKVLWMQLGAQNEEAANIARKAGLTVVQDNCMMAEHSRLIANK